MKERWETPDTALATASTPRTLQQHRETLLSTPWAPSAGKHAPMPLFSLTSVHPPPPTQDIDKKLG